MKMEMNEMELEQVNGGFGLNDIVNVFNKVVDTVEKTVKEIIGPSVVEIIKQPDFIMAKR